VKEMMIKSEKVMKRKGLFLFIVFIFSFVLIIGQLTYIVFVEGKNYDLVVLQNAANRNASITLNAERGMILDRNGIALAESVATYTLVFDPKLLLELNDDVRDETIAHTKQFLFEHMGFNTMDLDKILKEEYNFHYHVLGKGYTYSEIKDVKDAIDTFQLIGVYYEEKFERAYPYPELASDIIGFLNADEKGDYGIEATYNEYLKGDIGRIYGAIDEDKKSELKEVEAVDGADVMLTLDYTVQRYINESIDNFLAEEQAKKIHIIIMNPNNGEIYGMANWPDFSLDNPYDVVSYVSDEEYAEMDDQDKSDVLFQLWSNENVLDAYEPGSTFKPFVFAAALEENMVDPEATYTCYGSKKVANYNIGCWKAGGHGEQTIFEGLRNSCNVVFMDIGEAIGRDIFYRYQHMFGFGAVTGIDLSGEVSARNLVYTKDQLNVTELATSAFGQGFRVTPIQLITGFSALINGGYLYEPHLMKKIYTDDQVIMANNTNLVRQVISEDVSKITREALGGVVNEGTGKKASIAGYEIGGKTGTAEKAARDDEHYVVSFIGFAPIEDPQIVTLVVVDEPVGEDINSKYAASIFVDVMEDVMPYLHIFKTTPEQDPESEE